MNLDYKKTCKRCGGQIIYEEDSYGPDVRCLQCSHQAFIDTKEIARLIAERNKVNTTGGIARPLGSNEHHHYKDDRIRG